MKSKFTLEINKPCSEKFNNFTKTDLGGFCGSCQKEVIDFTGWSSQAIIDYFKTNSNKRTCGRFNDYQVGTHIESSKPSRLNYFKGIGITFLSLFSVSTTTAQINKPKVETLQLKKNRLKTNNLEQKFTVSGIVSDESGPLPGVSVILQGTLISTETNFDGEFEFPKKLKKGDILIFSFVGMDSKKVIISDKKSAAQTTLEVDMEMSSCMLMGEVSVKKPFKSKKKF